MPRRTSAPPRRGTRTPPSFNEAGAKCPGERLLRRRPRRHRRPASMRPGRNAPENQLIGRAYIAVRPASMRPGRNAPENVVIDDSACPAGVRFNEAGAKCPGEQSIQQAPGSSPSSFNEAGAKCPGEPSSLIDTYSSNRMLQ